MLITMLPFVWFTLGNVSRYAYLPSIGFSIAAGAVLVAAVDALGRSFQRRRMIAAGVFVLMVAFVGVRFSRFTIASVRSQVRWMEEWRDAARQLTRDARHEEHTVEVIVPERMNRMRFFLPSLLQWEYRDYSLVTSLRP